MKQLRIFIILLITTLSCYCQDNDSLIGEWKVESVESENFYYSATNDSVSLNKEFRHNIEKSNDIEHYINSLKLAYSNNRFFFDDKGNFNQTSDLATFASKYKIDKKRTVIEVRDTGIDGKKIKFEMPYKIVGNYLYIHLVIASTKFVLTKVR